ncbi:hypothetical protein D3C76_1624420 [compost metagenome]
MDTKFAAAITDMIAEHQIFSEPAIAVPQTITLFEEDFHATLNTLLDRQFGVFEVVTQHRLDQCRRMSPQTEQPQIRQQALPVQFLSLANCVTTKANQRK